MIDDPTNTIVHVCDFSGIRIVCKFRCERFGRFIIYMRIVIMQEQEKLFSVMPVNPFNRRTADFGTPAFVADGARKAFTKIVVIRVETLIQSKLRIQDKSTDYCGGGKTIFLQDFSKCQIRFT